MKFILCWKDKEILEIEKLGDKYFSKIIIKNFEEAVDTGFPYALISNVKVMDKELPKIIVRRLNNKVSPNNEKDLIAYINRTHLKYATDFISVYVEK